MWCGLDFRRWNWEHIEAQLSIFPIRGDRIDTKNVLTFGNGVGQSVFSWFASPSGWRTFEATSIEIGFG